MAEVTGVVADAVVVAEAEEEGAWEIVNMSRLQADLSVLGKYRATARREDQAGARVEVEEEAAQGS